MHTGGCDCAMYVAQEFPLKYHMINSQKISQPFIHEQYNLLLQLNDFILDITIFKCFELRNAYEYKTLRMMHSWVPINDVIFFYSDHTKLLEICGYTNHQPTKCSFISCLMFALQSVYLKSLSVIFDVIYFNNLITSIIRKLIVWFTITLNVQHSAVVFR